MYDVYSRQDVSEVDVPSLHEKTLELDRLEARNFALSYFPKTWDHVPALMGNVISCLWHRNGLVRMRKFALLFRLHLLRLLLVACE